ncbi:MAG: hypothetical protein LW636_12280, partial [Planctomycetaceae bacterium]|nr:hypothetical protein [Planctomycetaceae bacterium]
MACTWVEMFGGVAFGSRLTALAAASCALASTGAAEAAFTGYSVSVTTVGSLKKYEVFANFNGPNDTVLNAFHFNRTVGGGSPVFFHNDAISGGSSSVAGTWNPQFVLVPGALDSYVMIGGGEGFASGNATNADPDWGPASFNQAQVPFLAPGTTTAGPGWFNGNPPNNQGLRNAQGRVKLGQFVLAASQPQVILFFKIGYNAGAGTTVQFADGTFVLGAAGCIDCDANGTCDDEQIAQTPSLDCDANGQLDACQLAASPGLDCNANGRIDACDIAESPALDCDSNGQIDACQIASNPNSDCNDNGKVDGCDIADDPSLDCDANGRIDACDVANNPAGFDCDGDLFVDRCEIDQDPTLDCNGNGKLDSCDLVQSPGLDCNSNGAIDSCEIDQDPTLDCNGDGALDACQLASSPSLDC